MVQSPANYLKIYREEPPQTAQPRLEDSGRLPELLRAFQGATGWSLQYVPGPQPKVPTGLTWSTPVNPGVGATPGHLRLLPVGSPPQLEEAGARDLASSIAGLMGQLQQTCHALWQREAELAAGVPLKPHPQEKLHLAARLRSALEAGARAVGCEAAALYLLDEATTSLKLRSSWGLPTERIMDPPRRLAGALADLEAMLGHAVVVDDTDVRDVWNPPEDYLAAVCLPVSTPTTVLGTVWFFSDEKCDFSDRDTGMLEIVAGRVAAELEREMLLREGVDGAALKRQLAAAERAQRNQLPTIPPLLSGWEIAGWNKQSQGVGGDFYDWFALPDGLIAVAVADVMDQGIEAAVSANAVKAAMRAHGQYQREAHALLQQANMTLWTGSAGDQYASVFCSLVDTLTGQIRYASAGDLSAVHVQKDGWNSLVRRTARLGASPENTFRQEEIHLHPGEALVIFTDGIRDATDEAGNTLKEEGIAAPLIDLLHLPAKELVTACRDRFEAFAEDPNQDDRSVVIIKRADS